LTQVNNRLLRFPWIGVARLVRVRSAFGGNRADTHCEHFGF
jgi:hypothetical protein